MTYAYSTKQSIEQDTVFYIDVKHCKEEEPSVVLTVIIDCSSEEHNITIEKKNKGLSHQLIAELVHGASSYLDYISQ